MVGSSSYTSLATCLIRLGTLRLRDHRRTLTEEEQKQPTGSHVHRVETLSWRIPLALDVCECTGCWLLLMMPGMYARVLLARTPAISSNSPTAALSHILRPASVQVTDTLSCTPRSSGPLFSLSICLCLCLASLRRAKPNHASSSFTAGEGRKRDSQAFTRNPNIILKKVVNCWTSWWKKYMQMLSLWCFFNFSNSFKVDLRI